MNIILFFTIPILLCMLGLFLLFPKAGRKSWEALIPGYNIYVLVQIVGRPTYWTLLFFVPIVGIIIWLGLIVDLLNCFDKDKFHKHTLGVIFPYLYLPFIGFQKDTKFIGKLAELPVVQKSSSREWADSIGFAIVVASIVHWGFFQPFTIPTSSMEGSLLVGDFLFVSKIHYGPRSPITPLQVPLTHQKIWGTNIKSYLEWIKFPYFRFPGFTKIKRNDIVVFNVPNEPPGYNDLNLTIETAADIKTNYVKRCVAQAGDILEIKDKQLYINGEAQQNPEMIQFSYEIESENKVNKRNFLKYGIWDYQAVVGRAFIKGATEEAIEGFKQQKFIKQVVQSSAKNGEAEPGIFGNGKLPWNKDFFGPLQVPKKGLSIEINEKNLIKYGLVIQHYEGLNPDKIQINGGSLKIDNQEIKKYTFKQNYYFMMGDNRHASLDSRYWGFVPEDHVVGKAVLIWMSLDQNETGFSKIRWNRIFNLIK